MFQIICLVLSTVIFVGADECKPSITTASGTDAPQKICSEKLIYHEPFDQVDKTKWVPLVTFWDGGVNKALISIINFELRLSKNSLE